MRQILIGYIADEMAEGQTALFYTNHISYIIFSSVVFFLPFFKSKKFHKNGVVLVPSITTYN